MISFSPENFDLILFERELIEKEIKYVKSDRVTNRFKPAIAFYFEDLDYPAAEEIAGKYNSAERSFTGNKKSDQMYLIFIVIVMLFALILKFLA